MTLFSRKKLLFKLLDKLRVRCAYFWEGLCIWVQCCAGRGRNCHGEKIFQVLFEGFLRLWKLLWIIQIWKIEIVNRFKLQMLNTFGDKFKINNWPLCIKNSAFTFDSFIWLFKSLSLLIWVESRSELVGPSRQSLLEKSKSYLERKKNS